MIHYPNADQWTTLSGRAPGLSIAAGVFGATGLGLLVPDVVLLREK